MKKFIFLILTLAIPVSIFLFLKIFGSNEFEVPVLFADGIPGCDKQSGVHLVNYTSLVDEHGENLNIEKAHRFLIFTPLNSQDKSMLRERIMQMVRIQDAFYEIGAPKIIFINDQSDGISDITPELSEGGLLDPNYDIAFTDTHGFHDFIRCELGLHTREDMMSTALVLVDTEKRIRGMYNGMDMEQTEQLILELKIMRKQL